MENSFIVSFAQNLGISPEQMSMRGGMLFSSVAPLLGTILFFFLMKDLKHKSK